MQPPFFPLHFPSTFSPSVFPRCLPPTVSHCVCFSPPECVPRPWNWVGSPGGVTAGRTGCAPCCAPGGVTVTACGAPCAHAASSTAPPQQQMPAPSNTPADPTPQQVLAAPVQSPSMSCNVPLGLVEEAKAALRCARVQRQGHHHPHCHRHCHPRHSHSHPRHHNNNKQPCQLMPGRGAPPTPPHTSPHPCLHHWEGVTRTLMTMTASIRTNTSINTNSISTSTSISINNSSSSSSGGPLPPTSCIPG